MVNHCRAYKNVIQRWYWLKLWHLHQIEIIKNTENKRRFLSFCDVVYPKHIKIIITINIIKSSKQIDFTEYINITINFSYIILNCVESIKHIDSVSIPQNYILIHFIILNKIPNKIHIIIDEIVC